MGRHTQRVHRGGKQWTMEKKPCKQCGVDFIPLSRYNVYCGRCLLLIQGRTPAQIMGGLPR